MCFRSVIAFRSIATAIHSIQLFPPESTAKFLGPPTTVPPLGDNPVYAATETRPNGSISVAMDVAMDGPEEREFDNPLYGDRSTDNPAVDELQNEGAGGTPHSLKLITHHTHSTMNAFCQTNSIAY